jgi:hypothetical protein
VVLASATVPVAGSRRGGGQDGGRGGSQEKKQSRKIYEASSSSFCQDSKGARRVLTRYFCSCARLGNRVIYCLRILLWIRVLFFPPCLFFRFFPCPGVRLFLHLSRILSSLPPLLPPRYPLPDTAQPSAARLIHPLSFKRASFLWLHGFLLPRFT